ncbi:MAG: DUF3467 domain-containing protein [Bacteroidales bacterium]|jgi:hypothetical protein|nr:DUF3467 domain-containing protein [Bacteroidales bacterium]
MEDEKKQRKGQINIDLKEEVAQGVYSNLAVITHSSAEFVLDFVRVMPGVPKAEVKSRIILTPEHAKRFFHALKDNLEKFEKMHGPIKNSDGGGPSMPMNFGGPTAQA